jgi:hypothetical protein
VRFVVAALVLLVIVVLVLAAIVIAGQGIQRRRMARRAWELEERSDGELVAVYATKPGRSDLLLGSVPIAAEDFDIRLYELRAEADERVRVLNDKDQFAAGRRR